MTSRTGSALSLAMDASRIPGRMSETTGKPARQRGRNCDSGKQDRSARTVAGEEKGAQMQDPPPEMACRRGQDQRVGAASGCPVNLRLTAACAARPCSAAQAGRARRGTR